MQERFRALVQGILICFVRGGITVRLTSSLFCLNSAALLIAKVVTYLLVWFESKPVKQEVRCTLILPLTNKVSVLWLVHIDFDCDRDRQFFVSRCEDIVTVSHQLEWAKNYWNICATLGQSNSFNWLLFLSYFCVPTNVYFFLLFSGWVPTYLNGILHFEMPHIRR